MFKQTDLFIGTRVSVFELCYTHDNTHVHLFKNMALSNPRFITISATFHPIRKPQDELNLARPLLLRQPLKHIMSIKGEEMFNYGSK